jgi:hypothetical protein
VVDGGVVCPGKPCGAVVVLPLPLGAGAPGAGTITACHAGRCSTESLGDGWFEDTPEGSAVGVTRIEYEGAAGREGVQVSLRGVPGGTVLEASWAESDGTFACHSEARRTTTGRASGSATTASHRWSG